MKEANTNKKKIISKIIVFLILVFIQDACLRANNDLPILFFNFYKTIKYDSTDKAKQACFKNSKIILGAVEMYNMSQPNMMDELNLDLLYQGKYLNSDTIKIPYGCKCSYTGSNLINDPIISCSEHGTQKEDYTKQQETDTVNFQKNILFNILKLSAIIAICIFFVK